jgi:ABC-type methionine transport system ATPase subunit
MDEGELSMHIFDEHEKNNISQDNVVQTRAQTNKFKTKEKVEKEKERMRLNGTEQTKQEPIVNQVKNPRQMTYNVIDDLKKLRIALSFMEVVKIPQHRENIR